MGAEITIFFFIPYEVLSLESFPLNSAAVILHMVFLSEKNLRREFSSVVVRRVRRKSSEGQEGQEEKSNTGKLFMANHTLTRYEIRIFQERATGTKGVRCVICFIIKE